MWGSQSMYAWSMLGCSGECHLQQGSQCCRLHTAARSRFYWAKCWGAQGTVMPSVSYCCVRHATAADHLHRERVHRALKLAPRDVIHASNLNLSLSPSQPSCREGEVQHQPQEWRLLVSRAILQEW